STSTRRPPGIPNTSRTASIRPTPATCCSRRSCTTACWPVVVAPEGAGDRAAVAARAEAPAVAEPAVERRAAVERAAAPGPEVPAEVSAVAAARPEEPRGVGEVVVEVVLAALGVRRPGRAARAAEPRAPAARPRDPAARLRAQAVPGSE